MRLLFRVSPVVLCLALGGGVSCEPPAVHTEQGVIVSASGFTGRVQLALNALGSEALSADGVERLGNLKGRIAVDRIDKITGAPGALELGGLFDDPQLTALLEGTDEAAVAAAMREAGYTGLVLHHRAMPSVDRGGRVLSRLYHHDDLGHFSLFRVEDGLFYYKILDTPYGFPPQLAAAAIQYIRGRLQGRSPTTFPEIPSDSKYWTFIATLRGEGQELAVVLGQDANFQKALEEVIEDLEKEHRRRIELLGFPPLAIHIDDLTIEVQRVTERAWIGPRDEQFLEDFMEMGIDGAFIRTANNKERGVLPGAASYTRSIRSADGFLREAAKVGHMSERRPWRDSKAWLESLRTIHYRELSAGKGMAFMYRGVPAIPLEQVSMEAVRQGVLAAGDWYLKNLDERGQIVYKFWPSENRYSSEYNLVRHTLATWNLVQAWQLDKSRADYLDGSRRALAFTQSFLKRENVPGTSKTMAFYSFNNNQKLGTVVVNMLGMIDLARATGDHQWDEQLREMGRFVQFMQEDSGTFQGYHVDKGHAYYGQKNDIVPGEAALALVYLADYLDEDEWISTLPSFWEYYEPWYRERVQKSDPDAPWPAYTYNNTVRLDLVQFGPWTVMAANAYHARTGDQAVANFGLEVARWMIETYEWPSDNTPFPDYVGGYYKLPGELPAMQAFCYAEGTAAAYRMALRAAPDQAAFFELHTRETARFALQMQYDELNSYAFSRPEQSMGGIRYAMNETKVRVDYVHHALSAMFQWYQAAELDPNLAPEIRTGPALPAQKMRIERLANEAEARQAAIDAGLEPPATEQYALPVPNHLEIKGRASGSR